MTNKDYIWFQALTGGMNQSTDSSLVPNNESPLLLNVTLDQPGNYATRKGTTKLGGTISATEQGYGLFEYRSTAGVSKLMAVAERDLFAYDEGTSSWSATESNTWTASKKVNAVNYLNRLYLGSEDGVTALRYTTGTTTAAITPSIGGSKLAVNKSVLAVGGNSIKPNIIFYTNPFSDTFHSATGTCAANADVGGTNYLDVTTAIFEARIEGAVLYNTTEGAMAKVKDWVSSTRVLTDSDTSTWDNDTVYIIENNFTIDGNCTGIVGFGEEFIVFDENKMYKFDPLSEWSSDIGDYGCVNERTIQVVNGYLIWVGRNGVWIYGGSGLPESITDKIRDKVDGFGVWDLINQSYWGSICAGSKTNEGKYFLSLGTLSTLSGAPASAKTNAVLVYDVKKGSWTLRSYPDQFVAFSNFINSTGERELYGMYKTKGWVARLDTGTTDVVEAGTTTPISFEVRTPHYILGSPFVTHAIKEATIKYIAAGTVAVKYSKDRGTYATFKTLAASATVKIQAMKPPADTSAVSHSLSFTGSGKFILEGYGFYKGDATNLGIPYI